MACGPSLGWAHTDVALDIDHVAGEIGMPAAKRDDLPRPVGS